VDGSSTRRNRAWSQRIVAQESEPRLPHDGIGGAAVAVRIGNRTLFFNHASADIAQKRPITSDSLFNLGSIRKVFEATVVALAFERGDHVACVRSYPQ
jgi:beta-lactamase class C